MKAKPRILIINDDGIHAPGIKHLWKSLVDDFDLTIVAPASEKSGMGIAITVREPLHIDQVLWEKETPAWKINGTPADCVRLGISVILKQKPDLIVSGINQGSNTGTTILSSGTVGAVIEGALRNVPGIAFSCEDFFSPNYSIVEKYIAPIVRHMLDNPLRQGSLLNVNFPKTESIKGIRLARQGKGRWMENPDERMHPEGKPYYWMGGKWLEYEEYEDSDVAFLKQGYAAAVPIHVAELTDHCFLQQGDRSIEALFS